MSTLRASIAFLTPKFWPLPTFFVESAQKCAADFGIPAAQQDHRILLDDPTIDAIVICSATNTHTQFISEAAEAGKHIFCEKPIALDLADIDQALATVERCGVKLQIGLQPPV